MNAITLRDVLVERQAEQLGAGAQVLALHARANALSFIRLITDAGLEVEHALARPDERRGGDEARHLVAGKQRLLERRLARHAAVVGVRQDGADHPLRIALRSRRISLPRNGWSSRLGQRS